MEMSIHHGDVLTATTAIIAYPADSAGQVGVATVHDGRIVSPTMKHANEPIPPKQVELATVAALRCADEAGFVSVALPLFGTTTGQVDSETAQRIMLETIEMFRSDNTLQQVELWLPAV